MSGLRDLAGGSISRTRSRRWKALSVLRKDIRRFWPLALLLLASSLVHLLVGLEIPERFGLDSSYGFSLQLLLSPWWLLPFSVGLLALEDPAQDPKMHWGTLPLGPGAVASAKLLFVAVFAALPLLVAEGILLGSLGFSGGSWVAGLGETLLKTALLTAVAWGLASLVRSFRVFFVFAVASSLGLPLFFFLALEIGMRRRPLVPGHAFEGFWESEAHVLSLVVAFLLLGGAVVWSQFARRDRRRAAGILLAGLAGLTPASFFWSWDGLQGCPSGGISKQFEVLFLEDYADPHDGWTRSSKGRVRLHGMFRLVPEAPGKFVEFLGVRGALRLENGPTLESHVYSGDLQPRLEAEEFGLGARYINPWERKERWNPIFSVSEDLYGTHKETPGKLLLRPELTFCEFRRELEVPLVKDDAAVHQGHRLKVLGAGFLGEHIFVHFRHDESQPKLVRRSLGHSYVLVHRGRGEALIYDPMIGLRERRESANVLGLTSPRKEENVWHGSWGSHRASGLGPKFRSGEIIWAFKVPEGLEDPEEWLENASLVLLKQYCLGRGETEVQVDNFRMVESSEPFLKTRFLGEQP